MRVCFFARVATPEILETIEFYAQDIQALRDLGHEVAVVHRLGRVPLNCDLYFICWWTWALEPLVKARLRGRPTIIVGAFNYRTLEGITDGAGYTTRPWWQRWCIRYAVKSATANVFPSRFELDQVVEAFSVRNVHYIPWAVDADLYSPDDSCRDRFLLNVAHSGIFSGRRKCLREIVEAFALVRQQHPDVRLIMAGRPGDFLPTMVETAKRLSITDFVEFRGEVSLTEKIELMRRCAVYLQPTLFEGFGLATAEAMACGAPIITSPVGAVPEVAGDAAIMVDGQNPRAIADATIRLLDDPVYANQLGRSARARIVETFTHERRRTELAAVIAKVTGQ